MYIERGINKNIIIHAGSSSACLSTKLKLNPTTTFNATHCNNNSRENKIDVSCSHYRFFRLFHPLDTSTQKFFALLGTSLGMNWNLFILSLIFFLIINHGEKKTCKLRKFFPSSPIRILYCHASKWATQECEENERKNNVYGKIIKNEFPLRVFVPEIFNIARSMGSSRKILSGWFWDHSFSSSLSKRSIFTS